MSFKSFLLGGAAALLTLPAFAGDILVKDAYARSASAVAKTGAAFMEIENTGAVADRLVAVRSDAAARVELHTHLSGGDGIMRMVEVKDGFEIPANGAHMLKRGGDHVMFMGLTGPLTDGETVSVTLVFEHAGEVAVEIPIDSKRMPEGHGGHGAHKTH
ncbi:copper chaperone PCu(A)C [Tropicimonas sp. S265A]|uniref:copper chaperone PCu(A)C n=1 Tax=Tropicimonas sp. S265A TaxID=3415134 RepID=UPI003C7A9657